MINYKSFLKKVNKFVPEFDNLRILDVGAKGGIIEEFKKINNFVDYIGFEPNEAECRKLNFSSLENKKFLPYAIAKNNKQRKLYLHNYSSAHSLYKTNMKKISRYWDEENLKIYNEQSVTCVSLDYLYKNKIIDVPNFIKIDVEGAEFEILSGASNIISSKDCIGIKLESHFEEWKYNDDGESNKPFAEIDIFLRKLGFTLFDIKVYRHGKKSLVQPFSLDDGIKKVPGPTEIGKVLWSDSLYLRDPLENMENLSNNKNLVKTIILLDLFNQVDTAIEIVKYMSDKNSLYSDLLDEFTIILGGKKNIYSKSENKYKIQNSNKNFKYAQRLLIINNIKINLLRLFTSYIPDNIIKNLKKFIK
ncbi:FkbM family methyltransferase [Pelagibacteraceae bacterium]|nr:FkbM family methyltransferase [Pelagibacteraceae bacterium]